MGTSLERWNIYTGDCTEELKKIKSESVQTVVTSPPYWGLRDYGTATWVGGKEDCDHIANPNATKKMGNPEFNENRPSRTETKTKGYYKSICPKCGAGRIDSQLGLEDTMKGYVEKIVEIFREIRRVLRKDGTVWLNLGDSYSSGSRTTTTNDTLRGDTSVNVTRTPVAKEIKPKDLVGIPWRAAFALQEDGWYLRSDIIWHKPNPMPESVQDRPTKSHEYIFLLSKSPHYYYDADAIKEPVSDVSLKGWNSNRPSINTKYGTIENEARYRQGMHKERGEQIVEARPNLPSQEEFTDFMRKVTTPKNLASSSGIKLTTVEHWFRKDEQGFAYPSVDDWKAISDFVNDWSEEYQSIDIKIQDVTFHTDTVRSSELGRNKRDVWTVNTKSFPEAHFATFPEKLIDTCIKAGTSERGECPDCGKPWVRSNVVTKIPERETRDKYIGVIPGRNMASRMNSKGMEKIERKFLGWQPDCKHKSDPVPQIVLDPFSGAGTTGVVARKLNRIYIGIELNPEYAEMSKDRLARTVGATEEQSKDMKSNAVQGSLL